ncbi:hypothetical protein AVEN_242635-1, partial [Araneus ventricosus]
KYSAVLEELSKEIPAEKKPDALYIDGEVTEYSNQETDSETDVEENPVQEEIATQTPTQMRVSSIYSTSNLIIP